MDISTKITIDNTIVILLFVKDTESQPNTNTKTLEEILLLMDDKNKEKGKREEIIVNLYNPETMQHESATTINIEYGL